MKPLVILAQAVILCRSAELVRESWITGACRIARSRFCQIELVRTGLNWFNRRTCSHAVAALLECTRWTNYKFGSNVPSVNTPRAHMPGVMTNELRSVGDFFSLVSGIYASRPAAEWSKAPRQRPGMWDSLRGSQNMHLNPAELLHYYFRRTKG